MRWLVSFYFILTVFEHETCWMCITNFLDSLVNGYSSRAQKNCIPRIRPWRYQILTWSHCIEKSYNQKDGYVPYILWTCTIESLKNKIRSNSYLMLLRRVLFCVSLWAGLFHSPTSIFFTWRGGEGRWLRRSFPLVPRPRRLFLLPDPSCVLWKTHRSRILEQSRQRLTVVDF